jgi:hypothetical protein
MLKFSFHPSGHFKMTALLGDAEDAIDRATVVGPRLEEIVGPERMGGDTSAGRTAKVGSGSD